MNTQSENVKNNSFSYRDRYKPNQDKTKRNYNSDNFKKNGNRIYYNYNRGQAYYNTYQNDNIQYENTHHGFIWFRQNYTS